MKGKLFRGFLCHIDNAHAPSDKGCRKLLQRVVNRTHRDDHRANNPCCLSAPLSDVMKDGVVLKGVAKHVRRLADEAELSMVW